MATPVLWTTVLILIGLAALRLDVDDLVVDARPLRWVLAPATVALGVATGACSARRLEHARAAARGAIAVLVGGLVTSAVAGAVAAAMDATHEVVAVAATKSVSAPIALAVDLPLDVHDGLLAASCMLTGVYGVVLLPAFARRLRLDGDQPLGTGVGVTVHAIGRAELRRRRPEAVGWAAAGLALNGVLTALWLPPALRLVL